MSRRAPNHLGAHPLLWGIVLLILLAFAAYVSYTATRGLPFVPTYGLDVEFRNANQLSRGADVTIAGSRVGQVSGVDAEEDGDSTAAVVNLKLSEGTDPVPVDSRFSIGFSGALGRKIVEIEPGSSSETFDDGAYVALDQPGRQPGQELVDIDQLLNAFDARTREGARASIEAFGVGLAGRGTDLNAAIQHLPKLLRELDPAMRTLAASSTELRRFVVATGDFWGELAPVATELSGLVVDLDATFGALASVSRPYLESAIAESPRTLSVATDSLRRTRPFLRASSTLASELRPSSESMKTAAAPLGAAIEKGANNLPLVPGLSNRLVTATADVAEFAEVPSVRPGIQRLTQTGNALGPPLSFLTPAETTCSYGSLLLRNLASMVRESVDTGTLVRGGGVVTGVATNSERGPSSAIYDQQPSKALGPVHSNPYPNTSAPGQTKECEAGNEPYITNRAVIGNVPGKQKDSTESVVDLP